MSNIVGLSLARILEGRELWGGGFIGEDSLVPLRLRSFEGEIDAICKQRSFDRTVFVAMDVQRPPAADHAVILRILLN